MTKSAAPEASPQLRAASWVLALALGPLACATAADTSPGDDSPQMGGGGTGGSVSAGGHGTGGSGKGGSGGTSSVGGAAVQGAGGVGAAGSGGAGGASEGGAGVGGGNGGAAVGGAGGAMSCTKPADCPTPTNECVARTCAGGACGEMALAPGTHTASQIGGDCKARTCDQNGGIVEVDDPTDAPGDSNVCTADSCVNGAPTHTPEPKSKPCGVGGALACDGAGQCVGCALAADCPGDDTECSARSCSGGVCGMSNEVQGKPLMKQTAGDCALSQCDGKGGVETTTDDSDIPVDGETCTRDLCAAGVPSNPPEPKTTACSEGSGAQCDGAGKCVSCLDAKDCPGTDGECLVRTCDSGVCGTMNIALGTAISAQTAGDCAKAVCDGKGSTTSQNDDSDLPNDNNPCTDEVCKSGVASHPAKMDGATCGGALSCHGGVCVGCAAPTDCPGSDDECKTRTCVANSCGQTLASAGKAVTAQTPGDCKKQVCDGSGNTVSAIDDSDVPADDGNACTTEACQSGLPAHVPAAGAACTKGGTICNSSGQCVACLTAAQCPGQDTACQSRTCAGNNCGVSLQPPGTVTATQTTGDCEVNQCDGMGNQIPVPANGDVPADDGNECTGEVCNAGAPAHPPKSVDTACGPGGTLFCSATAVCVTCNSPSQCPGVDNPCHTRTCATGMCGANNPGAGTATSSQTPGDCQKTQCDGMGNVQSLTDDTDVPADDGNSCTSDACSGGMASHPAKPPGTPCNQNGGTECDSMGVCLARPTVVSTSPAAGGSPVASAPIVVTFSTAMNPATLTAQTTAGACTGSIQVSLDSFATCVGFSSGLATMSAGNTVATLTAAPGLLVHRSYATRVTTAATGASGLALSANYDLASVFTTNSPDTCGGSVVISQLYGGGGNAMATYTNDFVELHNRGATPVNLAGKSIQYAGATGTSWTAVALVGTIPPGGYFLLQLASAGAVGAALPTPDQMSSSINMAAGAGKVALIGATTPIASGNACPAGVPVLDLVGYGATANCKEGATVTPAPTALLSIVRAAAGCADVDNNGVDFATSAVTPRSGATAAAPCNCAAQNESGAGPEADYCDTQFPLSLSVATGTSTGMVFGRLFELGVTEAAGAASTARAQLGWGPPSSNPEYEAGWQWVNATYNVQSGNDDEYQASFTAPAVGAYRYVYRMSVDGGVTWTVCDRNAGDSGSGSNSGLTFDFADEPVLTATP